MNRSFLIRSVAWAAATLCASLAGAQTQPQIPPESTGDRLPAVHITGSALRHIDAETALPVIVLRRADIERSGARTTTELLQQLPVMQSMVQTASVVGTDSRGYASVSIHGLGDAYTLVLLNGQRVAPFGGQLSNGALPGVDINTIPLVMIERIEVLTDGASALYGADALGGVVNIITRRDGDANEAEVGVTWPRGGAHEWRLSALKSLGVLAQDGHSLSLGVSMLKRTALPAKARDYARESVIDFSHEGRRYRFNDAQYTSAPVNVYGTTGGGNAYLLANGHCPPGQDQDDAFAACRYNFAGDVDLVPQQDQHSVMASYTSQVGPDGKLQFDALWSRSVITSHLAPVAVNSAFEPYFWIPRASSLYGPPMASLGITDDYGFGLYRFVDAGLRRFKDTSTLWDTALRLDGRLQGWAWQAALTYSRSEQDSQIGNALSGRAAQSLVDNELFDPFALPGQQTPSAMAALRRQLYNGHWLGGRSTLAELQWQASRELMPLPGGPLKWAMGANLRRESMAFDPSLFAQGMLDDPAAGTLASTPGSGDLRLGDALAMTPSTASRYVWGGFMEWLAPLTPALDLGVAGRFDHDQLAGSALTAKTSARWRPAPGMLWRASLGTGFRAPTLNQLRLPGRSDSVTANSHDCTPALQAQAQALGAAPCVLGDPAAPFPLVVGGNGQLQPERSEQANIGFRFEPVAGHVLGLDLWTVHIHDRIGAVDESVAFENPAAAQYAWTTVPGTGGAQLALNGSPLNLGTLMSSGLDILGGIRRSTGLGLFDSQLRATVMLREDTQLYPGGPWFSAIDDGRYGGATLKWRANWRVSLVKSGWTHSLTARYQSGYEDAPVDVTVLDANGQPTSQTEPVRLKIPDQILWDWQSSWQLNGSLQLTAGLLNVFDTKPPLSLNQSGSNKGQMTGYDERYFDARGRMLVLEAKLSF